jgi:hypothetical protein
MQLLFHTGTLYAKGSAANATPQSFGTLQNVSLDLAFTTKELFGQLNFPVAVGQGNCKITGKAANAQIQARLFNDLFLGGTLAAGETVVANREVMAAIPTTPFQLTVTNSATWVEDWEVIDAATGLPFTKVASAPAAGQYSVAAGVYTFNTADTGKFPLISYSYTVAGAGQTVALSQTTVGAAPTFSMVLSGGYGAGALMPALKLYSCVASKLSLATKQNDFAMPNFEWLCMANAAGKVLDWSTTDAHG